MPNNNLNTMRLLESVQQLLETGRIFSTDCLTKRQLLVELRVTKSHIFSRESRRLL